MSMPYEFKGRIEELVDYVQKGGPGSGRKNLLNNIDKGEELANNLVKVKKSKGFLAVHKAIMLVQGYTPMGEEELKKAFDGKEIPENMKKEENRPPQEWFNSCMIKSQNFDDVEDRATFCCNMWKGEKEKGVCDGSQEGKKRRWKELSEAFSKMTESIDKCEKSEEVTKSIENAINKTLEEHPELAKQWQAMIPAAAGAVGEKIGEKIGEKVTDKKSGVTQKAVAEKAEGGTKPLIDKRKPTNDEGGECEVSGDPTKGSIKDLTPSTTLQDMKG